jgi:hypothetical protein
MGFLYDDRGEAAALGRKPLPEPRAHMLARGPLELGDVVQAGMIKKLVNLAQAGDKCV